MLRGKVRIDKKTKLLIQRIRPHEIAIINHRDLDRIAGEGLVEKQVKAVINQNDSISGKYPNQGPSVLVEADIPLIQVIAGDLFSSFHEGDELVYDRGIFYKNEKVIALGRILKKDEIKKKLKEARQNINQELSSFIDNTLNYARREKNIILDLEIPKIKTSLKNKHALIVIRGADYKNDLSAIKTYIREIDPVIIAVDGGADACLERGYQPDIIIGDMDSVSNKALKSGAEIIVHAYQDGCAPGLKRVRELGLDTTLFPAPGTSEDVAMLLAYEKGAELITAVGSHSHMIDFLEKGRPGMASTLLVRLKIGSRLVDAKGVSKLYQNRIYSHYWLQVILAILLPLGIIGFFSPPLKQLLQLLLLQISLIIR